MPIHIKICGVSDKQTALSAAAAGADAVGLVFVEESPRVVTMTQARDVVQALPVFVEPVGLFVDRPAEQVLETAGELGLRTVQLHGGESPEYVADLTGLRVIKAIGFTDQAAAHAELQRWHSPPEQLAGLLFDAAPPLGSATTGGNGLPPDWSAIAQLMHESDALDHLPPVILAGGLTPQNVGEAIRIVQPYAVDVSSGVESSRGVKDLALIAQFCAAVRAASRAR